ncbi:alpha/beta hydrolase [Alkalimarinus alittae]|uniref:Alpha/beta fold hydrolase n=1 Tax=Alkalimarinus alittae TaxID=2961619 RepID=A0ABY6MY60_9ALTE|nr:alpha/beta hydrolase [Alkalimarinus alittae]UZE94714.1 alpha/beta fold hydrolase [Alkalimarinus alittae]
MQSSSQLFPVQLVSAEVIGSLVEDIYLLKPNNCKDRTVELAVTRLTKQSSAALGIHGQPVILLHGAFSNRRHWLSEEGEGVADFLVEAGYDVWIPEMRGHGLSSVNQDFANNSLDQTVEYDLPAIHKFVLEQTGKNVSYIAEEMGGFLVLGALGLGVIDQKTITNCVYIEEEKPLSLRLNTKIFAKNALWRWRKQGVISGQRLGIGTENESYLTIKAYLSWQNRLAFNTPSGLLLEGALANIDVPVMVVGTKSSDAIGPVKNAKWIYSQLTTTSKSIKMYDYSESQTSRAYPNAGITLFPNKGGCWDDIILWLANTPTALDCTDAPDAISTQG